jgi:hypothetical protein
MSPPWTAGSTAKWWRFAAANPVALDARPRHTGLRAKSLFANGATR